MPTFRTEYFNANAPMVWHTMATISSGSVLLSMNAVTIEMIWRQVQPHRHIEAQA